MDYNKLVRKDAEGSYSIDERDTKRFEKKTANLPFAVGKQWDVKMENSTTNYTTVLSKEDFTAATNTYQNCFRIRTASASGDYTEEWLEGPGSSALKVASKRPRRSAR